MTTSHPVDSTTRPCCQGIGNHAQGCTTTTTPDVPLPAGAHVVANWDGEYGSRLIATRTKEIEGTDTGVCVLAEQLTDGALSADASVRVDRRCEVPSDGWSDCLELTAAGARQLGLALIVAAEQLDGWASSPFGLRLAGSAR
jgi:hypothetical protein